MQPLQGKGHVPKLSSRTKMVSFEAMYRSEIKKKKKNSPMNPVLNVACVDKIF